MITHATNKSFFEDLARRRFTILPDHLAKNPRAAIVEGVPDRRTLTDGSRTVNLYEVAGNDHSRSMLIVHLPAEKLLIEVDLYSPPAPNATTPTPQPFAKNLVENIDRLGLSIERIVPLHGRAGSLEALRNAAR